MSASMVSSYVFMYFVLFMAVPFVAVVFVLTCIKFFKGDKAPDYSSLQYINKPHFCNKQVLNYLHELNTLSEGKYDILYGINMDDVVEISNNQELKELLHLHKLDYVVIDHESAEVKLVITNEVDEPQSFINNIFSQFNISHIQLGKDGKYNINDIKTALAA